MDSGGSGNVLKRNAEKAEISGGENGKSESLPNGKKTKGRVKIKMEFIDNKLRRYTTFSKRKTGIMKKAYELSTLTGTQVMLLVASETGHVYTFATRKLQPMITSEAGKALIQTCLNSPEEGENEGRDGDQRMSAAGFEETDLSYDVDDKVDSDIDAEEQEEDDEGGEEQEGSPEDESSQTNDSPTNLSTHPYTSQSHLDQLQAGSISIQQSLERLRGSSVSLPPRSSFSSLLNPVSQAHKPVILTHSQSSDTGKPFVLAPSLPPEVLAQLGYTNLLAQASSSHKLATNVSTSASLSSSTRLLHLLPREPVPVATLVKLEPNQSPENLSIQKNPR